MSLPSGYTRLEYIESTGTQYINTGFNPNQNTRVDIDTELTAFTTYPTVFGCRKNNTNLFWVFASRSNTVEFGFGTFRQLANKTILKRTFISAQKNVLFVDGNATITATSDDFISEWPLYLFCCNSNRNPQYRANMKLYSCQIYDDGVLVRNFIPCKSASGGIGLWDSVNEAFYENAGSDEFTAGEERAAEDHHKCLIDGTTYEVKGGKCLVNGTAYSIKKGRTLIGGTGYDINFDPPVHIYGVEWDWTSSGQTKGTRTDAAASFGDPSPAVNNGSGSSPFDNLMPWSGMVKETRSGGVEVKEPKYWFKWTKTGKKLKLQIADGYVEGFSVDPVNRDRGDGLGELDYSYIGRYHCASGYKSTTGAAQQVNITRSQARTGIHNLGANFWQMDFAQFWYVNMLFLVEFADWNGERIGRGSSTSSSKMNNGQTDAMGYHTGTTAASRDSYGFTQYRNIEGWWDNVYDWMDGCYYNNNGLNVISNPNNFSDSANGTLVGTPSSGYPSDFTIPTASGLEWALFPSAANGSQTTYAPDDWFFGGNYPYLNHGGNYSRNRSHGPFCVKGNGASASNDSIGCRLQERPPKT